MNVIGYKVCDLDIGVGTGRGGGKGALGYMYMYIRYGESILDTSSGFLQSSLCFYATVNI